MLGFLACTGTSCSSRQTSLSGLNSIGRRSVHISHTLRKTASSPSGRRGRDSSSSNRSVRPIWWNLLWDIVARKMLRADFSLQRLRADSFSDRWTPAKTSNPPPVRPQLLCVQIPAACQWAPPVQVSHGHNMLQDFLRQQQCKAGPDRDGVFEGEADSEIWQQKIN